MSRARRLPRLVGMQQRMKNPILVIDGALPAMLAFAETAKQGPVPHKTLYLVYLRASQLNGCAVCVEMHVREAKHGGDTDARLHLVAGWREARCFTPAERAALALTEALTHLDTRDAVPDALWAEAQSQYDEQGLAQLLLNIAMINFWNRTNIPVRALAG